jgi:hypothetical protein
VLWETLQREVVIIYFLGTLPRTWGHAFILLESTIENVITYFAFLGGSGGFRCEEDLCEDHNRFNILPRMKISVEFVRMIPHKRIQ